MKTTLTFEISPHESAAIRTHLGDAELACATDGRWIEKFIEQVVQAALLNLRYQGFIEEAFRGAVTDRMSEDPTDIRTRTKMLRRPGHLKAPI
jgi:hypothetical protein